MPENKVYIAICSSRDWKAQFCSSLTGLINQCGRSRELAGYFMKIYQGASLLPKARRLAIEDAIAGGYTHILMMDDDSKFPVNTLDILLSRKKQVIGINYIAKEPTEERPVAFDFDGKRIFSKDKTGVQEVLQIGFGTVLIDLEIFKEFQKPWFEVRWLADRNEDVGEDIYFCIRARQHGIKIHVDHDLSHYCAHVGDYEYQEAKAAPVSVERAA